MMILLTNNNTTLYNTFLYYTIMFCIFADKKIHEADTV